MKALKACILVICLGILAACGGGNSSTSNSGVNTATASNVAGGYTLLASGGTLNDGSGTNGLAVLVTLRDGSGNGPGLNGGWQVSITGPNFTRPLTVSYDDGSPSSYQIWRWEGFSPATGSYTATASNGSLTLTYGFTINSASTLQRPALTKSGSTVSWGPVPGAGSYYYRVADGTGSTVTAGFLSADPNASSHSFQLPALADGSYLVEVFAHTKSLLQLMSDVSSAPSLPSQENISVSTMDLAVAGGVGGSYNLAAKGGTLYMGKDSTGTDRYGLVVWTSILTSTASPPAGDWTISVTGPGISTPLVFAYPRTDAHYVYWDFATPPASGNYTVTATTTGNVLSAGFTMPSPAAQLPVATNITVAPASGNYMITWDAVPGAASYYVNLWTSTGGTYTEIDGAWVNGSTYAVTIPKGSLSNGVVYDVYVTACSLDMTTMKSLPPPSPTQVNMADNTFGAITFTAQ